MISVESKSLKPPSLALTFLEAPRQLSEKACMRMSLPLLHQLPKGDSHPVMVIPGFAGNDHYNQPLIKFLKRQGYNATGWNRGRNFGHGLLDVDVLINRVNELYNMTEQSVSLIGHSLGGVYAREIAKLWPHEIRQVITLGSPFGGGRATASRANFLYNLLSPHKGNEDDSKWPEAPPVPTTAIYSRTDGIINWKIALQREGHSRTENIEIYSSHNGMTVNPSAWYVINDRLTQPEDDWCPFSQTMGIKQFAFPAPGWSAQSM